jgi:hypothetical protein
MAELEKKQKAKEEARLIQQKEQREREKIKQ